MCYNNYRKYEREVKRMSKLDKIKEMCSNCETCYDCIFYDWTYGECYFERMPISWDTKEIKKQIKKLNEQKER